MAGQIKVDSINADSNLALKIANTAVAFIDATGLRPVAGNLNLDATATSKFYLPSANTVAIQTAGVTAVTVDSSQNVTLAAALAVTGVTTVQAGAVGTPSITTTGDTNTGIYFPAADTIAFTEGGAEVMRINSSGNVGIGTTLSTAKLHSMVTSGTTTTVGRFEAAVGSYTGTSLIACNTLGNTSSYNLFSCITDSDADAGGPITEFLVRGDGIVMMGATNGPNYSERLKITFPNTQGIHCNESTSSSSVNYIYFTKGAGPTNVGAIYYNGSVMAYQTTSDYRLKENVAPMTGALSKIAALKPVTYTWKDNQQSGEGFLAHELQEHFPDAVSGTKDEVDEKGNPKYQGMDASILISTMVKAIQEQQVLITAQAATITALTARIVALENR
jgi:hypothetical protein